MSEKRLETWTDDDGTGYLVPVTLRQVEAHAIELNANSGIDENEHREMLDTEGEWRIRFGYRLSDGGDESQRVMDLQTYEIVFAYPEEGAQWRSALRLYQYPEGNKCYLSHLHNLQRVEALLDSVVPVDALRDAWDMARAEVETWIYEPDYSEDDES